MKERTIMSLNLSPREIALQYAEAGAVKARRPASQLIALGVLAGLLIALGGASTSTAVFGMSQPWTAKTVCALIFPFGLGMVVIMGAELFTGNCLIVISVLDGRCRWREMLRSWTIVYLANFAGALLAAAGCAFFGQMDLSGGQLALYVMRTAASKCAIPFANGVVLGFLCNVLVCLGVLMAMSARDSGGKLLCAYLPVSFFVLCGFEHSVANMYYISAGLMARAVPAYAQLAAETGLDLSGLSVGGFLLNLLPVTLGNILGGVSLGWLVWFCHLKK